MKNKTIRPSDSRSEGLTPILAGLGSICNIEDGKEIKN